MSELSTRSWRTSRPTVAPNASPHGHFAAAIRGACEQQIRNIGIGDEQEDESSPLGEQPQSAAKIRADEPIVKCYEDDIAQVSLAGFLTRNLRGQGGRFACGRIKRDTFSETGENGCAVISALLIGRVGPQWHPNFFIVVKMKSLLEDAYDLIRLVVDNHILADDVRGAKTIWPKLHHSR